MFELFFTQPQDKPHFFNTTGNDPTEGLFGYGPDGALIKAIRKTTGSRTLTVDYPEMLHGWSTRCVLWGDENTMSPCKRDVLLVLGNIISWINPFKLPAKEPTYELTFRGDEPIVYVPDSPTANDICTSRAESLSMYRTGDRDAQKELFFTYSIYGWNVKASRAIADRLAEKTGRLIVMPDLLDAAWLPDYAADPDWSFNDDSTPAERAELERFLRTRTSYADVSDHADAAMLWLLARGRHPLGGHHRGRLWLRRLHRQPAAARLSQRPRRRGGHVCHRRRSPQGAWRRLREEAHARGQR